MGVVGTGMPVQSGGYICSRVGARPTNCPGGEIGRRKGLKIPRLERAVPVRVRPRVQYLY